MSDFKLSNGLNKNKVFLVRRSEIEGRLDPLYYYENLDFTNTIKLGSIAKISGGKRLPKDVSYELTKTPYRYLRIGDIDSLNQLHYEDFEYLSERTFNILGRYEIINGDIALAIVGATIGKCVEIDAPYEDRIILTENCAKIHIENKNVYSKFLLLVLQSKFVQKQIELNYIQTTLPKLGLDRVYNLRIPKLPILDVQKNIVLKYNILHSKSREKQSQSKDLLKSIDSYLLNELGIVLPQKDDSLKARMFTTNYSEVCGGRLDCELFKKEFKDCFVAIEKGKYKSILLKNVLTFLESGSRPSGGVNNISNGILSFGGEHVNTQFEVGYGTPKYISEEYHKKIILTETKLNDIVLVKDGATTGKIGIIENEECINQNINEHVFLFRSNSAIIDQHYLCYYLHSTVGQLEIEKEITGATVTGISKTSVKNLRIPLPPLSKQIEIADHIKQIRQQAKQLEIEAEQILTDAKKEIEKMILGEE